MSDGQEEEDEDVVVHAVPIAPDVTVGGVEKSMTITILNDDGKYSTISVLKNISGGGKPIFRGGHKLKLN